MEAEYKEVIVIGGGMAGLLIAYYLKEEGKNVMVLEAAEIASGQTGRTTAKITSQHGLKYRKLSKEVGEENARQYAHANEAAIREYEHLIRKKNIECQFQRVPAYLYTRENTAPLYEEVDIAASFGIDAFFTKETELPFPVSGAVCFRNQAQFSPIPFVQAIASELDIREHTQVIDIRGKEVLTVNEIFSADQIIVATHYPFRNIPGFYFLRQHQERSHVLALSGCKKIEGMYYGVDQNGLSLRQMNDVLLLGGSSVRTSQNEKGGAYAFLEEAANQYFPGAVEKARWSAQDCMPHDGIPFIGKYSVFTPHLYVATGFQKWGMTTSMIAALILKDELCGQKSPYADLFSPQRIHLRAGTKNLLTDIGVSAKGLAKGWIGGNKKESGQKYPGRCPHMGCELTWNPDEKSWDCPCHGSRFDEDGNLLDNPAKKEI